MEQVYDKKSSCYGCGACANLCRTGAIKMQKDNKGFLYPVINKKLCVDCNSCKNACPIFKVDNKNEFQQKYFAVRHKDDFVLSRSSSGGMFSALAEVVLKDGGFVYGAYLSEDFIVSHIRIQKNDEIEKLRKSKYVQSIMTDVYQSVKRDIDSNHKVLFVGTPCQIAGLKNFLGNSKIENIYLCDFICHGVASQQLWKEYLLFLTQKYNCKIISYEFRNKSKGWRKRTPYIELSDRRDISEQHRNKESFFKMYATCLLNRPSCFQCQFTSYDRVSDITVGDFWNVGQTFKEFDDDRGTSEVLINTAKGMQLLTKCKELIVLKECTKQAVWQPHLEYPNEMPKRYKDFWDSYYEEGIEWAIDKYGKGSVVGELKRIGTPIVRKLGLYTIAGKLYAKFFERRGKNLR